MAEILADLFSHDPTSALTQHTRGPVQRRETTAREQHQQKPADAHGRVRTRPGARLAFHPAQEHPAGRTQHHREQEGRTSEHKEQRIRQPGADPADLVVHRRGDARERRKARVIGTIGRQSDEQHEGHHADGNEGTLAQAASYGRRKTNGIARLRLGFCHQPIIVPVRQARTYRPREAASLTHLLP